MWKFDQNLYYTNIAYCLPFALSYYVFLFSVILLPRQSATLTSRYRFWSTYAKKERIHFVIGCTFAFLYSFNIYYRNFIRFQLSVVVKIHSNCSFSWYTISSVSFRIFSLSRKYSILTFHSVYQQIVLLLFACICVVGIWNPFSGSIEFAWNIVLLTYFIAIAFIFLYHFIFYDLYGKKTNRKAQTLLNGVWWCILLFYWIKW